MSLSEVGGGLLLSCPSHVVLEAWSAHLVSLRLATWTHAKVASEVSHSTIVVVHEVAHLSSLAHDSHLL